MSESKRKTDPPGEVHFTDRSQSCVLCPIRGRDIENLGETVDAIQEARERNLAQINENLTDKVGWANYWQIYSVTVVILIAIIGALFYRQNENFQTHSHFLTHDQHVRAEEMQKERMDVIIKALDELKQEIKSMKK